MNEQDEYKKMSNIISKKYQTNFLDPIVKPILRTIRSFREENRVFGKVIGFGLVVYSIILFYVVMTNPYDILENIPILFTFASISIFIF